jgi:hypothetical protein
MLLVVFLSLLSPIEVQSAPPMTKGVDVAKFISWTMVKAICVKAKSKMDAVQVKVHSTLA